MRPGVVQLDPNAIYMAPSGRCCRWLPTETPADQRAERATFVYEGTSVTGDARRDEFMLARSNWRLLRRVA